jgi:transposase
MTMPWLEVDTMTLRREFVILAQQEGCNTSDLCKLFGISRKPGYKWLDCFEHPLIWSKSRLVYN